MFRDTFVSSSRLLCVAKVTVARSSQPIYADPFFLKVRQVEDSYHPVHYKVALAGYDSVESKWGDLSPWRHAVLQSGVLTHSGYNSLEPETMLLLVLRSTSFDGVPYQPGSSAGVEQVSY